MNPQCTLWGDELRDDLGANPEQYARALRVLLDAWQTAVLTDPATTPAYRTWVQKVVNSAHASLDNRGPAYAVLLLTVAPVFASPDDELVKVVEPSDDAAESRRVLS